VSWLSEAGELQGKPPRQASSQNQNGKRKVVVARERGGKAITKRFNSEAAGVAQIASVVEWGRGALGPPWTA
jgi:hypothetical protein